MAPWLAGSPLCQLSTQEAPLSFLEVAVASKEGSRGPGKPRVALTRGEVSLAHGATPQDLSPIHQPLLLGAGELGGKALLRGPGGGPRKPPGPTEHVTRVAKAPASPRRRREGRPGEGLEPDGEGLGGRGRLRAPAGLLAGERGQRRQLPVRIQIRARCAQQLRPRPRGLAAAPEEGLGAAAG